MQPARDLAWWGGGGGGRAPRPGGPGLWRTAAVLLRGHRASRLIVSIPRRPARSAMGDQRAELVVGLLGHARACWVVGFLRRGGRGGFPREGASHGCGWRG